MASSFATLSYHWAGRDNRYAEQLRNGLSAHRTQKLYYQTADFSLPGRQPISMSPITAVINVEPYFADKMNAFKAHTSQLPLWNQFEQTMRQRGPREKFHLAATTAYGPIIEETDLFAGIAEDRAA
jgi:LmbE family N-acetylglucosaminyl deacetylase